jgi:hypothetical protein
MNVEKSLATQIEENDEWVINSGCSQHMTSDKSNFVSMEKYEGGVRFGDDKASIIHGRGSIALDGKHNIDDVLYVEGLTHNILSVGHMVDKGYDLQFKNRKWKILSGSRNMIASSTKKVNTFHLKNW